MVGRTPGSRRAYTALHMSLPLIVSAGEALTDLVTAGGHRWEAHAGGAAWNVARACARLGVPSAFAGAVGSDNFGQDIVEQSRQAGLDLRFLQQTDAPTLLAVVYSKDPPAYRFMGENSADLQFDPARLPADWLQTARWLHLGGISLARWPLADTLLKLLDAAHAAGVKISFDPNARISHQHPDYPAVFRRVLEQADLIKLSDEDMAFFFPDQNEAQATATLREVNADAPLIVTRGAQGATLFEGGTRTDLPTFPVKVMDTVGAGDALCAGVLVSATERPAAAWTEHLGLGLRAAAAACARAGAYAPTREDLATL